MKVHGAVAFRLESPRKAVRHERELADLTTRPQRDDGGLAADALHIAPPRALWTELPAAVPGRLVEGTLPPDNFARFVLRLPRRWNGGLVVAAASGVTDERTYDLYFSDFALKNGYAFAATDKGVRRTVLDNDTVLIPHVPEASVRLWAGRLRALAELARAEAAAFYGRAPERTYAVGLSNGGFLARRAAEEGFVDGAVEVSGVLWRADKGNLLRELPAALRGERVFPEAEGRWAPVKALYRQLYWETSLRLFLGDLDPGYSGPPERYDLDSRPAALEAIRSFENTGRLKVPLISIAGRRDYLISCASHAEAYRDLCASPLHTLRIVEDASHIDTNADQFPFVRPLMPEAHAAFTELSSLHPR